MEPTDIKICVPVDYNDMYLIYFDGRVWSKFSNRFLNHKIVNKIHTVDIVHPIRKSRQISINKLVYHHFVEKIDLTRNDYVIRSKDGRYDNNLFSNLYYMSRGEQIRDTLLSKGFNIHKDIGRRSILRGMESEIYNLYHNENLTLSQLAVLYKTSDMSIFRAIKRYRVLNLPLNGYE